METTRRSSQTGDRPRVVLGVTGGIAAYKAAHLARLLASHADVRVVMTQAAARFVAPLTFTALTGRPALTDLFDNRTAGPVAHVHEAQDADLFVVAPATADFLARASAGRADDLLGAMLLVNRAPVVVAPAMNVRMWEHPATQRNLDTLRTLCKVHVVGPGEGELACGWTGTGRMAEPEEILERCLSVLKRGGVLEGRRVLITSGPTEEPLDPVRVISNRSSGRMGRALASEASAMGAEVTLVRGPVAIDDPAGVEVVAVRTTAQMHDAVMENLDGADLVIMAAAVADWKPTKVDSAKIRKADQGGTMRIQLEPTVDILASVCAARKAGRPLVVGFSLETDPRSAVAVARAKLRAKGCDMMVSNVASKNLGTDRGEVTILAPRARPLTVGPAPKEELARAILTRIASKLP